MAAGRGLSLSDKSRFEWADFCEKAGIRSNINANVMTVRFTIGYSCDLKTKIAKQNEYKKTVVR